ncbi:MAG: phospholipase [Caldilineaceae bacterium]|nr:phospholipase [Caldilineaceae bacterium]
MGDANPSDPLHQGQPILAMGEPLEDARAAMVLIHGRGATAESILQLGHELAQPNFAYIAPQAVHNTWYPQSFLAPTAQNQPWLDSALQRVGEIVAKINGAGIPNERILLAGFSQGACLVSEYAARHPQRYGGLLIFSGGLIGPPGGTRNDVGSLDETPVFIGCSDVDFHIPVERVHETTATFRRMGAVVNEQIYANMGHTINQDEIDHARAIVASLANGEANPK